MNREAKHRMGRSAGVPLEWTSVLAVIAHPDDASFGLGAILDAFVFAGVKVEVLCLTHGQAWTLEGAPGDLAALRGAELASAADVLGGRTRQAARGQPRTSGPGGARQCTVASAGAARQH